MLFEMQARKKIEQKAQERCCLKGRQKRQAGRQPHRSPRNIRRRSTPPKEDPTSEIASEAPPVLTAKWAQGKMSGMTSNRMTAAPRPPGPPDVGGAITFKLPARSHTVAQFVT